MITFKQFITEQEIKDLAELIKRDCKPFLEKSRHRGLLFRGVRNIGPGNETGKVSDPINEGKEILYWRKAVRTDRRPKDTNRDAHKIIDDWFEKEFGIRARSQALFVFGQGIRKHYLNQYGDPCVVFPIGDFKYVWSARVRDLYNLMDDEADMDDLDAVHTLQYKLETSAYTDSQLDAAIKDEKEIMIACEAYYAFPISAEESIRVALDIY